MAVMDLATYLERENLTDAQFGRIIGAHRISVWRMRMGTMMPSAVKMRTIAERTNGLVQPADFVFGSQP